ncbi:Mitogen-activated protein kinase MKC1 [Meyerozyma sp. JA9]|nr:Mitogen-activated protein kinase MKC1 [Meyerozyma sp. JA9]
MSSVAGKTVNTVFGQEFIIDKRFQIIKELGHGAYGIVCSAKYDDGSGSDDGNFVAIKKITNIFSKKILCKRSLRELKLLQFFRGHKNITCLYDLDIVPNPLTGDFNEIYLYEELMECDMHQIIRSGQPLSDSHYQSFIYQVLCGLKYIHSADVLHRDLKPGNLLVNADCELKICDFGLARGFSEDPEQNAGFMTEYVATRWYRAPEIMLSFTNYSKAIDIWSAGCILAELLGGKPLFRGKDYVDQLNQILLVLGTPDEPTLTKIGSVRAQNYVRSLPAMRKVPYSEIFPNANPLALDLLEKMLTLDPFKRISVEEALEHPYLSVWHDPQDEPRCQVKFDFKAFEKTDDMNVMKQLIMDEVKNFRDFVRRPIEEQQQIQLQMQMQQQDLQQRHQDQVQVGLPTPVAANQYSDVLNPYSSHSNSSSNNNAEVNTDPSQMNNDLQFYESVPKPQELPEFPFSPHNPSHDIHKPSPMDDDLFRLEEELGFGLDGGMYNSI